MRIKISEEFTKTPGGRFQIEGDFSGEEFRETILKPKFDEAKIKDEKLIIDLDGCYAFPPSFLEEAFGGLVRELKDGSIINTLDFVCLDEPSVVQEITEIIKDAMTNEKIRK